MIIDFHSHIGLSEDGACGKLEVVLENIQRFGIYRTVLFATDEKDRGVTYEPLNDKIIAVQNKYPDKIIAFSRIIPSKGSIALNELKRCYDLGFRGLKLKADDGFTAKEATIIFEYLSTKDNFPVIIHTAHQPENNPATWESLFKEFPNVNFILAHGGKDLYKLCAEIVAKYKNVYVDTTTLSYNRTRHLYEALGCEKIIFGSDYPYSHPAIELKKYEVLIKDRAALDRILFKNAAKLLGLNPNK